MMILRDYHRLHLLIRKKYLTYCCLYEFHIYIFCREDEDRQTRTLKISEKKKTNEVLSTSISINRNRTSRSPIVTQLPPPVPTVHIESSNKRRTARRTARRAISCLPDSSASARFVDGSKIRGLIPRHHSATARGRRRGFG